MKENIHPTYYPNATVICACGNTWHTGSTVETIRTDLCSNCHPFYTGEQRIVDSEGQVDRFYKKLQARQEFIDEQEARKAARISPERSVGDLDLNTRIVKSLTNAGLENVGQIIGKLEEGEDSLLAVEGFGRKALADVKKRLRQLGYMLPEDLLETAA